MKIQAASITLPLLDWRVLDENREYRIPSIDPKKLRKRPFLKGFGGFGHRSYVSIPWRESETCFFEARRGVKLPSRLPGGNAVQHILRRVYITGPQVRFDLAAFAALRPADLGPTTYEEAAKRWWSEKVRIRRGPNWSELPLNLALRSLATRFEDETKTRKRENDPSNEIDAKAPGISVLQPEISLVCLAPRAEIPSRAVSVLDDPAIWYWYDADAIGGSQADLSLIFVAEEAVSKKWDEGFSMVRRIRRELGWLHADLEFLFEVGWAVERKDERINQNLLKAARKVANGLSQLDHDEAHGFSPLLFAAWSAARANMLALLREQVATWVNVPLPKWLTDEVRSRTDETVRIYFQTVAHRLKQVRNDYPGSSALQLGLVDLVDKRVLDAGTTANYERERSSVFDTYKGLPTRQRKAVSIVIPIRGDVFPLVTCLESIARQTLVLECPEDIEILLIEDGPPDVANPVINAEDILALVENTALKKLKVHRFILHDHMGRSTARNVGVFNATKDTVMFVDASMVLDRCHLAEHMIRHHRIPNPNVALIGFKENLKLPDYTIESCRETLAGLGRIADARADWKWHHVIVEDELDADGVFRFASHSFHRGQTINYMQLTDYLQGLSATQRIGPRSLATFFQTNIVSVPIWPVRQVGGFHSIAFNDKLWGLEDSRLGAMLLANGVQFVPCPSATAFKIEHQSDAGQQEFDLERHRQLYEELLTEPMWQRAHEAEEEIRKLENDGKLSRLPPVSG